MELLESQVLSRDNLIRALNQVKRNKGAAGIDGLKTEEMSEHLKIHWPDIRQQLLDESYQPAPVKRVEIPKSDGSKRKLGIPTVTDRLIQQAIAQVISQLWEPDFHPCSFGFRPNKSCHHAVGELQRQVRRGKIWVVDLDLAKYFDTVNHDRLMHRLKMKISDQKLLRLINKYLKAGVMIDGRKTNNETGVPQGGPLSSLLGNIVLDELDWEIQRRDHAFVRYADDCQIYLRSRRAGERVMESITHFIEQKLRLKVNKLKSAVDKAWNRSYLGFTIERRRKRLKVTDKSIDKLKDKVRLISRRTRGQNLFSIIAELRKILLGWKAYFGIAEVQSPLRDLDKWIRRKLRCYILKQWGRSGYRQLRKRGISRQLAWNTSKSAHGPWRLSHSPALSMTLPAKYFDGLGLPRLVR